LFIAFLREITLGELKAQKGTSETENAGPASKPAKGKLGLSLTPLTSQTMRQFNIKDGLESGLVVTEVQTRKPGG
jgi:hypothetical protein